MTTSRHSPSAARSPRTRRPPLVKQLRKLADDVAAAGEVVDIWRSLFRFARGTTPADSILVALYRPIRQERVCVYAAAEEGEHDVAALLAMPLQGGPQTLAIRSGEVVITNDLGGGPNGRPELHVGAEVDPGTSTSSMAVPMRARGKTIGVVELQSYQCAAFGPRHATAMVVAAAMAALAADGLRMPVAARRRAELRAARQQIGVIIAERAFRTVYQPIMDLATNAVVGYEALSRFLDGGAPDQRFAEAEACGLGLALETATLRSALQGAPALPREAWLALNVSPQLILDRQPLRDLIAHRRRKIVLEVTEHAAIGDYALFRRALQRLPRRIELSIDDAGAGYASFRHLLELKPRFVKLNVEFVRDVDRDPARQALVRGLVAFATAGGSMLVAEGIETKAELATLRQLDVPLGQGYLLGRPSSPGGRP